MHVLAYLLTSALAMLFFAFPGVLFLRLFPAFSTLSKITTAVFISAGAWVCLSHYISWAGFSLTISALLLQVAFVSTFIISSLRSGWKINRPRFSIQYLVLALACVCLVFPLFFIFLPPGCDTSMHGYIARLIINNNGLPHSYRPILPLDDFGSYTAGYNMLTALVSGMSVGLLRYATNILSIMVYPFGLLAMIFLLQNFFSEKNAIYTAVIYFGVNSTFQGIIGWGGNPTFLSFAMCLFSWGLIIHSARSRSLVGFICASITIAALPLIHAIPAIGFVYISVSGYLILIYYFKNNFKWLVFSCLLMLLLVVLLLLPFIVHYQPEHSPELLKMIRDWQHQMMDNKPFGGLAANISSTLGELKYFIGDPLVIISAISLFVLVYFRKYKVILTVAILLVFAFALILNYCYWFLPFSELLYPERIAYFIVVGLALLFGLFISELEARGVQIRLKGSSVKVHVILLCLLAGFSLVRLFNGSVGLVRNKDTQYDSRLTDAFDWINAHTEKDAVFYVTYTGVGMWVPAFTNRATVGAHYHFVHLVKHVDDLLKASSGPSYIFVSQKDRNRNTEILAKTEGRAKVFSNEEIEIYH